MGAAQYGADAGHQFARAEGFGDVVVDARGQPPHPVFLFAAGGEHDDGKMFGLRRAPELAAQLQARDMG